MIKTYQGLLIYTSNGEEDNLLALLGKDYRASKYPLTADIENDIRSYGNRLTVRYWISDKEMPKDELQENFMKTLMGIGNARYAVHYSEITGYLWTDESIKVGGHYLLEELKSNVGKWLYMEIEYNK